MPPSTDFVLSSAGLIRQSQTSLEVADLERAFAFDREVLGMQRIFERTLEGPEFEAVTATPGPGQSSPLTQ